MADMTPEQIGDLADFLDGYAVDGHPFDWAEKLESAAKALRQLRELTGEQTDRGVTDEFTDAARKRLAVSLGEISEDLPAITVMNTASVRIDRLTDEIASLMSCPPCRECGAMNPKDAEIRCNCGGDKDHCHGCQLWPD